MECIINVKYIPNGDLWDEIMNKLLVLAHTFNLKVTRLKIVNFWYFVQNPEKTHNIDERITGVYILQNTMVVGEGGMKMAAGKKMKTEGVEK